MRWERPSFVEIVMSSELGAYQDDLIFAGEAPPAPTPAPAADRAEPAPRPPDAVEPSR